MVAIINEILHDTSSPLPQTLSSGHYSKSGKNLYKFTIRIFIIFVWTTWKCFTAGYLHVNGIRDFNYAFKFWYNEILILASRCSLLDFSHFKFRKSSVSSLSEFMKASDVQDCRLIRLVLGGNPW